MPQPAPQPPNPDPPRKASPSPTDAPPPGQDAAPPQPAAGGALFRALLDARCGPVVAYTAEKQMYAMTSETVAAQVQPVLAEMRRRFNEHGAQLSDLVRNVNALTQVVTRQGERLAEHDRKLDALAKGAAERDRKLDVLVARLDGLKVLGQVILGALALLTTALIAVFGFLLTS